MDDITYNVIKVDLPGHGDNQGFVKEDDFSLDAYRKFLLSKINSIDDEILLFGNSLGGHLGIDIAPSIPNLKGLVLMGTPPVKKPINPEEAWVISTALNTFFTENPTDAEIENAIKEVTFYEDVRRRNIDDFKKSNPLVRKKIAEEVATNNLPDQYSIFIELKIPKFFLVGDSDLTVNRGYLQECTKNAKGICKLIDIKKCGHYPTDAPKEIGQLMNNIAEKVFN